MIFRRRPDIVHFHSVGPSSLIFLLKLFRPKLKIVFTFHCQDYHHQKWGRLARWYLKLGESIGCRYADQVITISEELKKYSKEKYGIEATYIPNGAEKVTESDSDLLSAWNLQKGEYFVSISRLVRHKGIHYLIEAYQKLNTEKKLVIVGGGAFTDEYVAELKKLAADNPKIIFQSFLQIQNIHTHKHFYAHFRQTKILNLKQFKVNHRRFCKTFQDVVFTRDVKSVLKFVPKKFRHLTISPKTTIALVFASNKY